MRHIRAVLKILLVILYTVTLYTIYFFFYILFIPAGARHEPLRNFAMRSISKGNSKILNISYEMTGSPPRAPFFLVLNHLSYLDILPLFIFTRCTFVAKKEVENWPVLGFMVKTMGVIFIDRQNRKDVIRVNRVISDTLNKYQGLVIFPEGTTSGGKTILPFKPSLLDYPATVKLPVYAAAISYQTTEKDLPASESVCFYGARESFGKHFYKMAQNRAIRCSIHFGEDAVVSSDRKELSMALHKKTESYIEKIG